MKNALVDISHVSLDLPGADHPILSNINYHIHPGDFVIILGSNGSGKSSLLKVLSRQYHTSTGHVFLNKKSIHEYSASEFSRAVVTLTQNTQESLFGSLTVLENYLLVKQRHEPELFSVSHKKEKIFFAEFLREFNVNLCNKLDQVVDRLSGGEKQALMLALSVLYPPSILLMDEHTSALDPKSAQQLMALTQRVANEHHITCLLTTHDLDIALEYGNRILALRQGEIFQHFDYEKKEALTQRDLLSVCY